MLKGLSDVDWSSLHHFYGPADEVPTLLAAMVSADAEERSAALGTFYNRVHHQGSVNHCTTVAVPFLFQIAADPAVPGRAKVIDLLVSIGSQAFQHQQDSEEFGVAVDYTGEELRPGETYAAVRDRFEVFADLATGPDRAVRMAAMPAFAWFIDDASRALADLRGRFEAADSLVEKLVAIDAVATLAGRLPVATDGAVAWFDSLAADETADPHLRFAALVERIRYVPECIDEVLPTVVASLRQSSESPILAEEWVDPMEISAPEDTDAGSRPRVKAVFDDLRRRSTTYAPTTRLLTFLHESLGSRIAARRELLMAQLQHADPGTRLDAVRMAGEVLQSRHEDNTELIELVAGQLGKELMVAAEAARTLSTSRLKTEAVREALAECIAEHYEIYAPDVWATPDLLLRPAHQEAVCALARLGDVRAVPSLLIALDRDVDAWRAIEVAGFVPKAADELGPRLCDHLRRIDLSTLKSRHDSDAAALLAALGGLGDPRGVQAIEDTLRTAVYRRLWWLAEAALAALTALGPAAAATEGTIRTIIDRFDAPDVAVRALRAVTDDREELPPNKPGL